MVFLLPYIEQGNMYQSWQFTGGNSGYVNAVNRALSNNITLKVYRCPSSPLPMFAPSATTVMQGTYVGISGASNSVGIVGFTEARLNTNAATGCCGGGGHASFGGTLFAGSKVRLAEITDGTSTTMVVSENSDWITDSGGVKRQWTAGGLYGWSMGTNSNAYTTASPTDNRMFNCTTIRYSINAKTAVAGWTGSCTQGVCSDNGNNIPLTSTHTGGVLAVFGDGHVQFISDSTAISVLGQLATRDDGTVIPNF